MKFEYQPKPDKKLEADFKRRKKAGLNDFGGFNAFKHWYDSNNKVCHYCGLTEADCQRIVVTGILKSGRFPENGKLGRGKHRGMWLEIDRKDPKEKYSPSNCVLCCYFCNNDKSDVFHGDSYKQFQMDRVGFLRSLLCSGN